MNNDKKETSYISNPGHSINYNAAAEYVQVVNVAKGYLIGNIKIKKIHKDAIIPEYLTEGSSGFDFSSVKNVILEPGEVTLVPTGLTVELPIGTEMQIRPRSGLAGKHMVTILNAPGTIDSDYRGELKMLMINFSKRPYAITIGDRIAQGILAPYIKATFKELSKNEDLSETIRGTGGYGHTGV